MITTILFDLDGTLLPMDQEIFIKTYFRGISKKAEPHGYGSMMLVGTIWKGISAMIQNDGTHTNEEVFWNLFEKTYGESARKDISVFDSFYANEFDEVQKVCGHNSGVPKLIGKLKTGGLRIALATNPIFPKIATDRRICWAGLTPQDFEFITTYENSRYCKPNLNYYRDILDKLQVPANECIMIGNDVSEDMVAEQLGMKVFLLTDCMINKNNEDISKYPHGGFDDLSAYLHQEGLI